MWRHLLTAVTNILDGDFPKQSKTLAEMTPHPTTGNTVTAQFVDTGYRVNQSFNLELGWDVDEATHAAIQAAYESTDPVNCSVEDPGGKEVMAGQAFIEEVERASKMKDGYKGTVKVTPTGDWTITTA